MKLHCRIHTVAGIAALLILFVTTAIAAASSQTSARSKAPARCTAKMSLPTLEKCQLRALAHATEIVRQWKQQKSSVKPRTVLWHEHKRVWLTRELRETRSLMRATGIRPVRAVKSSAAAKTSSAKTTSAKTSAKDCRRGRAKCSGTKLAPLPVPVPDPSGADSGSDPGSGSGSGSDAGSGSSSGSGSGGSGSTGLESASGSGSSSASVFSGRWWTGSSRLNVPIGPNPAIHSNSQAMIDAAIKPIYGPVLDTAYGTNVYYVDSSTPLVKVTTDRYPVGAVHQIPIPARAEPTSGSDSKVGIIRKDTGEAWELWLARKQLDGSWLAGSAGKTNVKTGSGFFAESTTGSGGSSFNLVRPDEFATGRIDHALVISAKTDYVASHFVSPAIRTDGKSTHAAAIPEGARVQLDPNFDVSKLPQPWMRVVAKALQEYGAYVTDRGGATAIGVMGNQSDDVVATRFPFGAYGDLNATGIKNHLRVLAG